MGFVVPHVVRLEYICPGFARLHRLCEVADARAPRVPKSPTSPSDTLELGCCCGYFCSLACPNSSQFSGAAVFNMDSEQGAGFGDTHARRGVQQTAVELLQLCTK